MTRDEIYLEVLRLASQLLINQYTDKRANLHNKWLVDSDELWRIRKLKLAYPPIPPYPTDEEICFCANKLLRFVEYDEPVISDIPEDDNVSSLPDVSEKNVDVDCDTSDNDLAENNFKSNTDIDPTAILETKEPSVDPRPIFSWIKKAWK